MEGTSTLLAETQISASVLHEVVRGTQADTGRPVVVKRARLTHDPAAAREEIDHERRALRTLAGLRGVPTLLDGGPNEVETADLGGVDLAAVDPAETFDLPTFLTARHTSGAHPGGDPRTWAAPPRPPPRQHRPAS